MREVDALLLSREWRDADDGVEVVLWGRAVEGAVRVRLPRQEAVMFVPRAAPARAPRRRELPLATFEGRAVDALYFRSQRALREERDRLRALGHETLESDVKPSDRFVMERFVTGGMRVAGPCRERQGILSFDAPRITASDVRPALSLLALDLETDDLGGPVLSAAIATAERSLVLVTSERTAPVAGAELVRGEAALLRRLFQEIQALDPDVICGWNVVEYDLAVLEARCRALGVPFALGRAGERARVLAPSSPGRASIARVPGRVVLDGIATLRSATWSFERYTLEHVARELLGRGKKIAETDDPVAEIRRMHADDPAALAAYNLEDCKLVLDIFAEADLLGFAVERAHLTGLPMDRQGGSVAAFDHLYLPRVHRRGFVARDVDAEVELVPSPGGHVLESVPGLYRDVLSFDFRSLYPSIIRTFRIDPLGLAVPGEDPVPGEDGAAFAREGAILPELVTSLHEARSRALATKNAALARAIKILMNSFYGVLGTPGCRFFDARLPTSITRRGHEIIERARTFFEAEGLPVIYGDTDSVFVALPHPEGEAAPDEAAVAARGRALAGALTRTLAEEIARDHRVESVLELRFESHYLRFLMPTTRGAERGSKKRYAGLVRREGGDLAVVVKGLEAVRRDWSPLARRVQRELLGRVFRGEPFEDWLRGLVKDLREGRLDDELVFRKREGREVTELVMTRAGLEPPSATTAPIDHDHYVLKQLGPACDVVLPFVGTSFERAAGAQTSLF